MVPYVFEQQRNPRPPAVAGPGYSERIECAGLAGRFRPWTPTRGQVAAVVSDSATALVDAFYSTLLSDAEAGPRLSHEIVSTRLSSAMKAGSGLLCVRDQGDIAALMATQKKVGEVHARVHIPIHLVMAGARILKNEIALRLRASDLDGMAASVATHVCNLFDLAIEQMSRAFMRDVNRGAATRPTGCSRWGRTSPPSASGSAPRCSNGARPC